MANAARIHTVERGHDPVFAGHVMRPWRDRAEWGAPEHIFLPGKPQQVSQVGVAAAKLHD